MPALVKVLDGGPVSAGTAASVWALMEICVKNPEGQQQLLEHEGLVKVLPAWPACTHAKHDVHQLMTAMQHTDTLLCCVSGVRPSLTPPVSELVHLGLYLLHMPPGT